MLAISKLPYTATAYNAYCTVQEKLASKRLRHGLSGLLRLNIGLGATNVLLQLQQLRGHLHVVLEVILGI